MAFARWRYGARSWLFTLCPRCFGDAVGFGCAPERECWDAAHGVVREASAMKNADGAVHAWTHRSSWDGAHRIFQARQNAIYQHSNHDRARQARANGNPAGGEAGGSECQRCSVAAELAKPWLCGARQGAPPLASPAGATEECFVRERAEDPWNGIQRFNHTASPPIETRAGRAQAEGPGWCLPALLSAKTARGSRRRRVPEVLSRSPPPKVNAGHRLVPQAADGARGGLNATLSWATTAALVSLHFARREE